MLVLIPPSETKRRGGEPGTTLDLDALSFPSLTRERRATLAAVRRMSSNLTTAAAALGLGPKSSSEAALNRELRTSPLMPAIDRFDGVLYAGLDVATLPDHARRRLGERTLVQSAMFGLIGALDPIPAYRLSADSRVPGLSLRSTWSVPVGAILARTSGLILDLRSESYAALGPLPDRGDAVFVRVVSDDGSGRRRAVNHFNKEAKGQLLRAVMLSDQDPGSVAELLAWAGELGIRLEHGAPGELDLLV